jgi:hypothetical protein
VVYGEMGVVCWEVRLGVVVRREVGLVCMEGSWFVGRKGWDCGSWGGGAGIMVRRKWGLVGM